MGGDKNALNTLVKLQKAEKVQNIIGAWSDEPGKLEKNEVNTGLLELGNNLSRALTSELAMLASPKTIPLFLQKYQWKQIKQYQRRDPIYKGIRKEIKDPKGTTIISMKETIERSREFLDALKKSKDKSPDCLVKPKMVMKTKGTATYRGTFRTVEEARASDKVICLIPPLTASSTK